MNRGFLKNFHFEPDGDTTLADALCGFIKDEIAFGRLKAGEPIPTIKGSMRILVSMRKSILSHGTKGRELMRILTIRITKMKLVPQRGWKRRCFLTFSTVSSSPLS